MATTLTDEEIHNICLSLKAIEMLATDGYLASALEMLKKNDVVTKSNVFHKDFITNIRNTRLKYQKALKSLGSPTPKY